MTYSEEQIKDLIYLKQKGCIGRLCSTCQWDSSERDIRCFFQHQPEWDKTKPLGAYTMKRIKEVATRILKRIIFEEPE